MCVCTPARTHDEHILGAFNEQAPAGSSPSAPLRHNCRPAANSQALAPPCWPIARARRKGLAPALRSHATHSTWPLVEPLDLHAHTVLLLDCWRPVRLGPGLRVHGPSRADTLLLGWDRAPSNSSIQIRSRCQASMGRRMVASTCVTPVSELALLRARGRGLPSAWKLCDHSPQSTGARSLFLRPRRRRRARRSHTGIAAPPLPAAEACLPAHAWQPQPQCPAGNARRTRSSARR